MPSDPKILLLAFLGGMLPSLLWLWFWLKEDRKKAESKLVLAIIFILGIIAVPIVIPIEKIIQAHASGVYQITFLAAAEEAIKYLAVMAVLYRSKLVERPIEWPIYFITAALGFAAMENALFLLKPLSTGATTVSLLTGQLRFLGSTLLHSVASGIMGIALGISFYESELRKKWHVFIGFFYAVALHSVFNFFIMRSGSGEFLKIYAFLWVVTIIVMLMFERVRRLSYIN